MYVFGKSDQHPCTLREGESDINGKFVSLRKIIETVRGPSGSESQKGLTGIFTAHLDGKRSNFRRGWRKVTAPKILKWPRWV